MIVQKVPQRHILVSQVVKSESLIFMEPPLWMFGCRQPIVTTKVVREPSIRSSGPKDTGTPAGPVGTPIS